MPSLKDIQTKISGIKKTKQITKAMNMVASAKLRGAQRKIEHFRPYAEKFYAMLQDISEKAAEETHPLLEVREVRKTCAILLATSDRGLCGSFNMNIITAALKIAREKAQEGLDIVFYCAGKKGHDAILKSSYAIKKASNDVISRVEFGHASEYGRTILHAYAQKELDEVILVYGKFVNILTQQPVVQQLLPIEGPAAQMPTEHAGDPLQRSSGEAFAAMEYTYEPAVEKLLAALLPRFITVQIYRAFLDTAASEHAARMAAMDNATSSCNDLLENLTLIYNKTRQAAITSDLMDIVGGAEALKG